jgi:hypothetical protein
MQLILLVLTVLVALVAMAHPQQFEAQQNILLAAAAVLHIKQELPEPAVLVVEGPVQLELAIHPAFLAQ